MDYMLKEAVQKNRRARGLAVIVYNSYEDTRNYLSGTIRDGEVMKETFDTLGFATISLHDVTKSNFESIIKELAIYSDYPEGYDCFVVYFAGHGDKNSVLVATDGEFDFEKIVVQRLNKEIFPDVSDRVTKVKILAFIDACRGDQDPLMKRIYDESLAPKNMMVAYATREKFMALEDPRGGGIWTQRLARELKCSNKSVRDILEDVKGNMPKEYKREALPVTWNAAAGDIKLNKLAGGGGDGRGGDGGGVSTKANGNPKKGDAEKWLYDKSRQNALFDSKEPENRPQDAAKVQLFVRRYRSSYKP